MIVRERRDGTLLESRVSSAAYSDCERYRYDLSRSWDPGKPRLNFLMLNPSTATETANDPTVERCERRARSMGFGELAVTNLFAWRATDPRELDRVGDPVGPENDDKIAERARWADMVVAAWGVHGDRMGRGAAVKARLAELGVALHHLGLTGQGHPRHPLYVPYLRAPVEWT